MLRPIPPTGPVPCRLAIVGDYPDDSSIEHGVPFAGPAGRELAKMFEQLGCSLYDCCLTYAIPHPCDEEPTDADILSQRDRLAAELVACQPNVILALGDLAAHLATGRTGIKNIRGAVHTSTLPGLEHTKVIVTYPPETIQRQYGLRAIALSDLEKAIAESSTPEVRHEFAEIWTEPTIEDLNTFAARYLSNTRLLSADIETRRGQITCVGLAPTRNLAIVVPFWRGTSPVNYWPTLALEVKARRWVMRYLESTEVVKVHQNGMYDIQYYIREGTQPRACSEDTMLAHHSLWSELPKNLGYLGATFTDFRTWKGIHKIRADEQLKKDD